MEWLERMMSAIDYLEAHMEDRPEVSEAAKAAYSSTYH